MMASSTPEILRRPAMTLEQKARIRQKKMQLTQDLDNGRLSYLMSAKDIAEKHGKSIDWTSKQLLLGANALRNKRDVNPWNAFTRKQVELANQGLQPGDRHKLNTFITDNLEDLRVKYQALSKEEKQILVEELRETRNMRGQVKRTNPKAATRDVNATCNAMIQEFHAVNKRTGLEGFFMGVRCDIEDHHMPQIWCSSGGEKFMKDVLQRDPSRLAIQLESYMISGLAGSARKRGPHTRVEIIADIRKYINEGFAAILLKDGITKPPIINYRNYELQIVEKYGIVLDGFLLPTVVNPEQAGSRKNLEKILKSLKDGTCKWIKLSDEELESRVQRNRQLEEEGRSLYHRRKPRASKPTEMVQPEAGENC